jgi:predicted nuclease with RNAse H fold
VGPEPPRREVFVGIDVASGKGRSLPISFVAHEHERLVPLKVPLELLSRFPRGPGNREIEALQPFRRHAEEVRSAISGVAERYRWSVRCIAIDAPAAPPRVGKRRSEQALCEAGISCFQTPSLIGWGSIVRDCRKHLRDGRPLNRLPNANRIWMLYGFELFAALRLLTPEVIEVYPQAIARTLVGPDCPHKSSEAGYSRQLSAIAKSTGWDACSLERELKTTVSGKRDDRVDAFMAAWVASLLGGQRRAYGNSADLDDAIWAQADTFI